MRVIIEDRFKYREELELDYVPNIGDTIVWRYSPFPKVKEKLWNFKAKLIILILE